MHTFHLVAVKVDSDIVLDNPIEVAKEEASSNVKFTLQGDERPYATWYDWFVVGGGRFVEGDAYSDSNDNAIAYHNEPEKFIAEMNKVLDWRKTNIEHKIKSLKESEYDFTTELEKKLHPANGGTYSLSIWYALELSKLALGYWTPDAHFYDLSNGTNTTEYILKDIEEGRGHEWVLVPVDFHY